MQNSNWYKFFKNIKPEIISFSFLVSLLWFIRSPLKNTTELLEFEVEPKTIPFNQEFLNQVYEKAKHKYIWNYSPTQIIHKLEKTHKIREYAFSFTSVREIFPPRFMLYLRDHQPVAVLFDDNFEKIQGVVDRNGYVFKNVTPQQITTIEFLLNKKLLKVRGFKNIIIRWAALYLLICDSQTKIYEVIWEKGHDITFGTEAGYVFFGEYINMDQLRKRFFYMDHLHNLWREGNLFSEVHVNLTKSAHCYIDLTENKTPILSMLDDVSSFRIKDDNYRWPSQLKDE